MEDVTEEVANYVIKYYAALLSWDEMDALKHHKHSLKLHDMPNNEVRRQLADKVMAGKGRCV